MKKIPKREQWLYEKKNKHILKEIKQGLKDCKEGRVTKVKNLKKFLKGL